MSARKLAPGCRWRTFLTSLVDRCRAPRPLHEEEHRYWNVDGKFAYNKAEGSVACGESTSVWEAAMSGMGTFCVLRHERLPSEHRSFMRLRADAVGGAGMVMRRSIETRDKERGIIQVLLYRLNELRMPRLLKLKEQVDRGEPLSALDLEFLKRALREGGEARRLAMRHPEYQPIVEQMTQLYNESIARGARPRIDTSDVY